MFYLLYVNSDGEPVVLLGPDNNEANVLQKMMDYIEVGYVSGKRHKLTEDEIALIKMNRFFYTEVGTCEAGWYVMKTKVLP